MAPSSLAVCRVRAPARAYDLSSTIRVLRDDVCTPSFLKHLPWGRGDELSALEEHLACRHYHWEHAVFLYTHYDEFDQAANTMMAGASKPLDLAEVPAVPCGQFGAMSSKIVSIYPDTQPTCQILVFNMYLVLIMTMRSQPPTYRCLGNTGPLSQLVLYAFDLSTSDAEQCLWSGASLQHERVARACFRTSRFHFLFLFSMYVSLEVYRSHFCRNAINPFRTLNVLCYSALAGEAPSFGFGHALWLLGFGILFF